MKQGTILFLGVYLLFMASQSAFGGAIQNINWDPQVDSFILTVTFGAVEAGATNTHNISLGGPWTVNFTVTETPAALLGGGQDVVDIIGSARHQAAPHPGDAAAGSPWTIDDGDGLGRFRFLAPLTIPVTGIITPNVGPIARDHPAIGHFDEFSLFIVANVSQGLVFRDIDSWELTMRGEHFVPEPSTLLLLGSSLAGLGAAAWRRQRRK